MANTPANGLRAVQCASISNLKANASALRQSLARRRWLFLAAAILLSPVVIAQNTPQVTGIAPPSGKVNDTATVSGTNLDKPGVSAVFLSDDKNDYKATVVEQSSEKIVIKIPQVKAGDYNVSIQEGDKLFIKPVKFRVEE
ncbi:MAG: IPT/TIG domain-containing protein [Acidobacteriia bacterium]|nr:IPT/TIG domain-containing protein [Terriglobia bacterium]